MTSALPAKPRFQRLLHDSLLNSVHRVPAKIALLTETQALTYADLFDKVGRCAAALVRSGLRRGDRVVIYADNTAECVIGIWATLWAGGVFVVVNPQTKKDKLLYILARSEARILISDDHLKHQFMPILTEAGTLVSVLCSNLDPQTPRSVGQIVISDFWGALAAESTLAQPVFNTPLDVAALIFTSGSTGVPKGVTMTHQAMVFARDSITEYLRMSEDDKLLNLLPLAFDYGLYQLLISVGLGATLVLERSFTYPGKVFDRIQSERVSVFPGVPTIFSTMVAMHQKTPLRFPSVTRVTNTAAALPPDYVPLLRSIFPNALIFAMYGLSECKRVSYLEPELVDSKRGSVGKAIPGTEMVLLSPEGKPVPPGQPGILHVRGPHVMLGYWQDAEATEKVIKPGRFPGERLLCAQDWFVMDPEGFFYFQGRSDDIIKTRGEKVSPVEVENVLYSLRGITEAAVIGVTDENLGQAIKAFVALAEGAVLTPRDIQRHCAARLENFMVPSQIEIVPELPKTTSGKIKKEGLR